MDFNFFNQLILILAVSVATIAVFHRFSLPESIGYLFVGIVLGPSVSGVITTDFDITLLAEIGVVFLLFTLGLEFSLKTITAMKKEVFGIGGLQVLLSAAGIFTLLMLLKFPLLISLVCACALSLSSTAIVSKELTQSNEIRTRQGQLAIGTLLFQDIAAVLFLIMVPPLIGGAEQGIFTALAFALLKGALFVGVMLATGKWVLPRLFHEIAKANSDELFVLMALVVSLTAAWLSHAFGLSMALGGFVAGMMISESQYKHQVEADIKPFRDVLLGLFFVSVGLMLDRVTMLEFWPEIIAATVGLIALKFTIVFVLARAAKESKNTAMRAALSLAQGGEFCFALIALATQYGEEDGKLTSIVLATTILSMVIAPLLIRNSHHFSGWFGFNKTEKLMQYIKEVEVRKQTAHLRQHTLICGYGRVGQTIARFLRQEDKSFVAIDDDPIHVHEACLAGDTVFYGDCQKFELLQAVGLERVSQVVICVDSSTPSLSVVRDIRSHYPNLPILVRMKDDRHSQALIDAGATVVIPELLESSLVVVQHTLLMLGLNPLHVQQRVDEARSKGYRILNGYYPGLSDYLQDNHELKIRHAITIKPETRLDGFAVSSLMDAMSQVELMELRRNGHIITTQEDTILQADDIIVLSGHIQEITQLEKTLR